MKKFFVPYKKIVKRKKGGRLAQVKDFIFLLDNMQAIKKSLLLSTGTSWKAYKLNWGNEGRSELISVMQKPETKA